MAWLGLDWLGFRFGFALPCFFLSLWLSWRGVAWRGNCFRFRDIAWLGLACCHLFAWRGSAWIGLAWFRFWFCLALLFFIVMAALAWRGVAIVFVFLTSLGLAWLVVILISSPWLGLAWLVLFVLFSWSCFVLAWLGLFCPALSCLIVLSCLGSPIVLAYRAYI